MDTPQYLPYRVGRPGVQHSSNTGPRDDANRDNLEDPLTTQSTSSLLPNPWDELDDDADPEVKDDSVYLGSGIINNPSRSPKFDYVAGSRVQRRDTSRYDDADRRVQSIMQEAALTNAASLSDLGLALAQPGVGNTRLVSTVSASDTSFRPKPYFWEALDEPDATVPDPMGSWPSRLLYIPEWLSYRWAKGNSYGGFKEPKHAVLSYTWGRWELRCDHQPPCPSLPVKGITWKIPSICPKLFSVDTFKNALMRVAKEAYLDFVWVDIACIDQNLGSEEKAREIGRQAKIFRGAHQAFVVPLAMVTSYKKSTLGVWLLSGQAVPLRTSRRGLAVRLGVRRKRSEEKVPPEPGPRVPGYHGSAEQCEAPGAPLLEGRSRGQAA
ncbi:hypothetical protein PG994_007121 [Apiospora phragmitis]|uniref:Heterokaryon incompatibility domain-containing protein n=1 Tax=Apiospora phragmitis TaxID=2905665 RepID=A0ABR1UZV5_9PEZI